MILGDQGFGGTEVLTYEYAKGMQGRGHEVLVVAGATNSLSGRILRNAMD